MRRIFASILAVLCLWYGLRLSLFWTVLAEETACTAMAYVLMECETETVLTETNGDKRLPCGMMAKLMTALLVAEQLENNRWTVETELTASDAVSGIKGAVIWLMPGEVMTVGDLLKGLLIGNANDAAAVFAVEISGNQDAFVREMNARAFDLEMRNTYFTSPQGYSDERAYTTAYDLGLLCCALAKMEELAPYFQTWRDFLRGEETELVNENTLTRTDDTNIGFKACHTEADGWSIAAGAERDGMRCVVVVLGCQTEEERFSLAKSLLRSGFVGWKVVQPEFSSEFLYPMEVRGGVDGAVLLEPDHLQGLVVPKSCTEIETVLVLPNYVEAPVRQGQKLGVVAFYQGDTLLYETTVVAAQTVRKRNFWDAFRKIFVKMHEL